MSETAQLVGGGAFYGAAMRIADLLQSPQGFNSYEHKTLADLVRFDPIALLGDWNPTTLRLADDLKLQYGQVIALSGDLYGETFAPVSSGTSEADRQKRFRAAYARLVNADRDELKKVLGVMNGEAQFIDEQLRINGVWPDKAYPRGDFDTKYRKATNLEQYIPPYSRYLLLAVNNFDHFGVDAVAAYRAGHAVAIDAAVAARASLDAGTAQDAAASLLEKALAMNAFADHFLTDLFAAGHLRTPRRRLAEQNGGEPKEGAAMAKSQHAEDNAYGLFVSNALGERWHCTGDATLLTPAGDANRRRALAAVRTSAQEVIEAFRNGLALNADHYQALKMAPDVALASKDEALDAVPVVDTNLNHVAQFIDRSAANPGIALVLSIFVRNPLKSIDSRLVQTLRENDGVLFSLGEDEFLRTITGEDHDLYGPPKTALPKPPAPVVTGTQMSDGNRGLAHTRYAIAYVGTRNYPDGGSAEYLSEPSDWSAWIEAGSGQAPVVEIPPLGTIAGRATPTGVAIIRQQYRTRPDLNIARLPVETIKRRFVDVR